MALEVRDNGLELLSKIFRARDSALEVFSWTRRPEMLAVQERSEEGSRQREKLVKTFQLDI